MTDDDTQRRLRSEADEEFDFHLQEHAEQLVREGWDSADALREARARFGNLERARTATVTLELQHADRDRAIWSGLTQDIRDAARALRRHPISTAVGVAMIGIGMAGATIVFAVASALISPPSDVDDPDRLVAIYTSTDTGDPYGFNALADFEEIRAGVPALATVAALGDGVAVLDESQDAPQLLFEVVSASYFGVAGIPLVAGRSFAPEEDGVGTAQRVVVLGHHVWQERLHGDRTVVGSTVRLSGRPYLVIGVAAPGVASRNGLPVRVDGWVPLGIDDPLSDVPPDQLASGERLLAIVGRLADGATVASLQGQLNAMADGLARDSPDSWVTPRGEPRRFAVLSDREARLAPQLRAPLLAAGGLLLLCALLVLIAASLNVASVFVSRWESRWKEMGVRLALGARRWQLVRLLLIESTAVAILSAGLAVWLTRGALGLMSTVSLPVPIPLSFAFDVDGQVLLFSAGLTFATVFVVGMLPARRATGLEPAAALRRGAIRGASHSRSRFRQVVIVGQVAVSALLVACAGVMTRSLLVLSSTDPGFDASGVVVTARQLDADLGSAASRTATNELLERLRARPEVSDAAVAGAVQLTFLNGGQIADVRANAGDDAAQVLYNPVGERFFSLLDIRPSRGRTFDDRDRFGGVQTAVVNDEFVRQFWPGQSGLGERFIVDTPSRRARSGAAAPEALEVVGVVPTGKYRRLDEDPRPYFWTSLDQDPSAQLTVLVRARGELAGAIEALREEAEPREGETMAVPATPLENLVGLSSFLPRLTSRGLSYAGLVGLVVAVVGVYGLVSLTMVQRRREVVVRLALGASPGQAAWLMARSALWLTLVGTVCGLAAAIPILFGVRALITGVEPLDPVSLLVTMALIGGTGLIASLVPALRVHRLDVADVVRAE